MYYRFCWAYLDTTLQVTSKKKSIRHNLPIQIGFFVYQYAKLRMLAFLFDVIDEFINREDYCLLEMDTGNFGVMLKCQSYYISVTYDNCETQGNILEKLIL